MNQTKPNPVNQVTSTGCRIVLSRPGTPIESWPECSAPAVDCYAGIPVCLPHWAEIEAAR